MSGTKKKRNRQDLSRVIQKKTEQLLNKPKKIKGKKSKFLISKDQKQLRHRAEKYDNLVRSLLDRKTHDANHVLIFNYQDGFVLTDVNNFGKYSIKL
ncbi:late transcription unit protein LtuB [Chlamydia crocodili]|uniref:Late transcription unit protein LtuB n=1 Tax=Chlamydia crocodili TaxID=2766982 RepID=A0ABX8CHB6_9CHLA|nr:late transcription unit protein LtuB [Chlamydia crocodili]QVE48992.1 late transcription unit protein LtuB [Chlamydia crocodili]